MRNFLFTSFFKKQVRPSSTESADLSSNVGFLKKTKTPAFSLIELLVAITIGSIILTLVMMSYASMVQTNIRLDESRKLQKQANFAVMRMADRIRNFSVVLPDAQADGLVSDETRLVIGKERGVFEFGEISENIRMDGQQLFSDNVIVEEINFKYSKSERKIQPWVQIYLKIRSRKNEEITNWVRTTISSRIFQ